MVTLSCYLLEQVKESLFSFSSMTKATKTNKCRNIKIIEGIRMHAYKCVHVVQLSTLISFESWRYDNMSLKRDRFLNKLNTRLILITRCC